MRRTSLSTKLFAAALPLVLAIGALLAITVRSDLDDVRRAEAGADLGRVWQPLIGAMSAIEAEIADGFTDRLDDDGAIDAGREATDQAIAAVSAAVAELDVADGATRQLTDARIALEAGRTAADGAHRLGTLTPRVDPFESYEAASRQLVAIGQLLPVASDDADLSRDLLTLARLGEARLAADAVVHATTKWANDPTDPSVLTEARGAFTQLERAVTEFELTANDDWAAQYRASGFPLAITDFRTQLDSVILAANRGEVRQFDIEGFGQLVGGGVQFLETLAQDTIDGETAKADANRQDALIRIGVILAAVLLAALIAWVIIRSITRRVKAVSASANQVARDQLPTLVEALRDPRGKAALPEIQPVDARGNDELAELADAFNSMQSTLVDVAHEQVEVLRRGVSDLFVTMARRNRSLIDRQLALLDEFEAEVDDPEVLANYYQLDHLSTRMRRNSESLLVLANADPKRRRVKATEIDDVVRAAIGEVEEYRRIEVETLDSLQVRGTVVADVAHLIAELLDNATSFSPPETPVRVGGRRTDDAYILRIVDSGVGIGSERMRELNELLREPPVVGLSVEATLGMSVVSLLANKHGVEVTLAAGNPGLTVDVVLPSSVFGPIDAPTAIAGPQGLVVDGATATAVPTPPPAPAAAEPAGPEPIVAWNDAATEPIFDGVGVGPLDESFRSADELAGPAPLLHSDPTDPLLAAPVPPNSAGPAAAAAAAPVAEAIEPIDPSAGHPDLPHRDIPVPAMAAPEGTAPDDPKSMLSDIELLSAEITAAADASDTAERPEAPPARATGPATDTSSPAATISTGPATPTLAPGTNGDRAVPAPAAPAGAATSATAPTTSPPPAPDPGLAAAAAAARPPGLPGLPPPAAATRRHGEFDVPPAPPLTTNGLASRPVTPDATRPLPSRPAPQQVASALPTRTPSRGPDGPDRLGDEPIADTRPVVPTREPSALQAALSAFDSGRRADTSALPTRTPVGDQAAPVDEAATVTQSRLDPAALRERLRAFQTEFRTGHDRGEHDQHSDLGGDPR